MDHSNRRVEIEKLDKLAQQIAYLIHAFILDTISEEEHDELDNWVCASMKNQRLFEELTDPAYIEKSRKYAQMKPPPNRLPFAGGDSNGIFGSFMART